MGLRLSIPPPFCTLRASFSRDASAHTFERQAEKRGSSEEVIENTEDIIDRHAAEMVEGESTGRENIGDVPAVEKDEYR